MSYDYDILLGHTHMIEISIIFIVLKKPLKYIEL